VVVRVARELTGLAAAESTQVEPMVESVVPAAASAASAALAVAAAALVASLAAWAARAERDRVAVARVVPSMEDRALTLAL
jgi:purine nucleoside phosphorylase